MYRLIENIKIESRSESWANKRVAEFHYDVDKNHYRLIELTPDFQFIIGLTERNDSNCPVVAKGFIAYLIRNWGKKEVDIYNSYYSSCFANFERIESKKPGSYSRNLNSEFYPLHVSHEEECVKFSKQIKPFLSEAEIKLINQYVKAYFEYIEQIYSPKDKIEKKTTAQTGKELSVPDWCIIFYYIDEAGNQEGAKIDRIIDFITENNIRNSNGKLTTKGSFKKQYYEIYHRINGTENSKGDKLPPLPPERIKNILHFLKKNKKALQTAENDIVHLFNEIEENKKNND